MGWVEGLLTVFGAIAEAAMADKKDRARIIAETISAHEGAVEAVADFWNSTGGELARGLAAIARAKERAAAPPPSTAA